MQRRQPTTTRSLCMMENYTAPEEAREPKDPNGSLFMMEDFIAPKGSTEEDLYPTRQQHGDTYPKKASRNNITGHDGDVLDRMQIREVCEGWGCYRDAAEWQNFRSMFYDDAYIATSCKQAPIDEFIEASKEAFALGSSLMYILHRINGQTVDVQGDRAVSKMKVTITCRFTFDEIEMDNEADCRFFFMLEKREGEWGVCLYTLLFDKDKMLPVHPGRSFDISCKEVDKFPSGYRYLAWCENQNGSPPKMDPTAHGPECDVLYWKCKSWLDGEPVVPNLTGYDDIGRINDISQPKY
ncbi:hypothetical protein BDZ85DRAFT_265326 [Elsinoe ampelina]|uniref:SnoaL-like domain-containing protein n=1 Tax=Elsinoe ampelina TaxID=302913 RepID=A0A6A6G757_9PEZI|nr:hypothetical protein BDZ85DRAFT_265326 [Elsinoe ampelina]